MPASAQLECPQCHWRSLCGPAQMLDWLRSVRMVRRDAVPEPEMLPELFRATAARFVCPQCNSVGLAVDDQNDDEDDDEAWGMARKCESCGRPIARERLEALPDARLCVACQGQSDRGADAEGAEYCPRCGSVMTIGQTRRGLTRYVMVCPQCRQ